MKPEDLGYSFRAREFNRYVCNVLFSPDCPHIAYKKGTYPACFYHKYRGCLHPKHPANIALEDAVLEDL